MLFLQLGSANLSHKSTVEPSRPLLSVKDRDDNDDEDEDDWSRRQDDLWDKYHRLHRASSPHRQPPFRNRELRFGIPILQLLNSCNF
jgi:hypothetical protein